jgi:Tol biopolymer transport system component
MPLKFKPGTYRWPSLSPDGRTFVVGMQDGLVRNLWTGQVDGEPLTRLTFGNDDVFTLFSPDGKWIYFTSGRNGRYNIFRTRADGSGDAERVTDSPNAHRATSFSPDGRVLLFNEIDQSGNCDIMQIDDSGTIKPFVKTQFSELQGVFSPDGRWVAYASNESGRWQVYIQPYPGPGARRQISVDFGQLPLWSPKGDELFFQGAAAVMAVRILNGSPDGTPHPLFPHSGVAAGGKGVMWNASITRDGQRFLMVDSADPSSAPTQISVIFNWFEELKTSTTDGKP